MSINTKLKLVVISLSILLMIQTFIPCFSNIVNAAETILTWDISEGEDGSVNAILDSDGVLTITGTGKMKNWTTYKNVPWYKYTSYIKTVVIEEGVTNVGSYAFYLCQYMESIILAEGITNIGSYSFTNCATITEITIPSTVTNIDSFAFYYCYYLSGIYVDEANEYYMDEDGVLFNKDRTVLIQYPPAREGVEDLGLEGVTSIGDAALSACRELTEIELPEGIVSIGDSAFSYCTALTYAYIPSTVTYIGEERCFSSCYNLLEIDVSENNEYYSDIDGVLFNKDATTILAYPGGNTSSTYTVPDTVTRIGSCAFFINYGLNIVYLSEYVTEIGSYSFCYAYNLRQIEVSEDNEIYTSVDGVVYSKDKTKIIKYPAGKIDSEYEILESVTTVGECAFHSCMYLETVVIPESVRSLGNHAFLSDYMDYIYIPESVQEIGEDVFSDATIVLCYKTTFAAEHLRNTNDEVKYLIVDEIYEIDGKYIKRIEPGTLYEDFKNELESNQSYVIKEGTTTTSDSDITKTAAAISIGNINIELVVTGDVNGDGKIRASDISLVKSNIVSLSSLEGAYLKAADVNYDGEIKASDLSILKCIVIGI